MPRLDLDPTAVAQELAALQRKLGHGLGALRRAAGARPGFSPRTPIFQLDDVRLYRYTAADENRARIPLLLVYALVNRPDMVDLQAGRSLVEALLARGFDVYLLDWGEPVAADRARGLEDYLCRYLDAAVDALAARLKRKKINLLGICQGGTFGTCYAALYPEKVERLVTTVTPIDFHTGDDMLSYLIRGVDVEALIAARGNINGDSLNALFLSLKPFRLAQQKYVKLIEQLDDDEAIASFLRMEHWIFDSPMLTAQISLEFARDFYQRNLLVQGGLTVAGKRVDLSRLSAPVLNLYARGDHLVPPASSKALARLLKPSQYTEHELAGGHIGVYVSTDAAHSVPQRVAEWFMSA